MDALDNINWSSDDGVFFPMLNDFRRNQYYDEIIEDSVAGKNCIDVGFGTGMLSLMALKHGAQHITAYEKDFNRYQLGLYIIEHLGLSDRIHLHHQEFTWKTDVNPDAIIISETVNTQLWAERLWFSMPRQRSQTWLPGSVFMDIVAEPISHAFAEDLFRPADHHGFFNPGVDLPAKFVELVNQQAKKVVPERSQQFCTDNHQTTVWGGWTFLRYAQLKQPRAGYQVELGTRSITFWNLRESTKQPIDPINVENYEIRITLDLPQKDNLPVLIVPRVGLEHNTKNGTKRLFLDTAESWGGGCTPMVVTDASKTVTIIHNVINGLITYSVE